MQHGKPAILRVNQDAVRQGMKRKRIPNFDVLAERLSVSRATIYRTVTGSDTPNPAVLAGLHLWLGIPWTRLLVAEDPNVDTASERLAS
ncbi:Cro protein [Gordonia phage Huffy]|uniref:Cro protein n=1 Tax=Gordonia phage TZGordon TaxID=2744004 RepID=A0A6N0A636_9CAUD|nr:transcriptional repressor [Gordonia phage TZGordon]AQY55643.1 Cro protein [Gordonia phage Huffy]AQY55725.1 Cro protein [Gordonia phage DinoDaryn]QKO02962.1 Cro protein [Gordonia phage TZGordon]